MERKIQFIFRVLAIPFVFSTIWLAYTFYALRNSYLFLLYGGEWITYTKDDRNTIRDIYLKLKENDKL